jgi:serine/threonine-protein kinase
MAPEKLRGEAGDRRSDIWSLGCVLWEALTLKRLFKGGNDSDTMRQVLESEIPLPSKINGDVLAVFDPIVMRALQRDPDQRYPTAKEMAADLEEVLRKEGYGGKNERIAKYMQATFKAHIDARKRLLQEVSSKGRASADVLEAAFDDPMLASGSPVHVHTGDFSVRFKPNTIEVRPQTGKPAHTDTTPSRRVGDPYGQVAAAAPPHFEYPRATLSDLPPVVAGDHEDEFAATVLSAPIIDGDDGEAARPAAAAPTAATEHAKRRVMYLAIAGVALVTLVVVIAIAIASGSGDPARADNAALLGGSGSGSDDAPAPPDAAEIAAAVPDDAGAPATPPDDAAAAPAGADDASIDSGSEDPVEVELPPDHLKPRPPKPDPTALYRSGINAYVVGDVKTAMVQFRRAIAASPGFAMAWRGLGMAHERLGDTRAATAAFQRYLQLAPNASDAATIRGKIDGSR